MARQGAKVKKAARGGFARRDGLRAWGRRHAYGFFSSLGEIVRRPVNSTMTMMVLALALSLPIGLAVVIAQISHFTAGIDRNHGLSVFLQDKATEGEALALASEWSSWPNVLAVDPISPEQGLAEALAALGVMQVGIEGMSNPIPWVLVVTPAQSEETSLLAERLSLDTDVAQVIVDLEWLTRLDAWMALGQRAVWVLGGLLLLAFVFVIAHTIRMEVHQRRHQIEVMALVGATPAFIRRPFLYSGFWFGAGAATVSLLIIYGAWRMMLGPLQRLLFADTGASIALGLTPAWAVVLIIGMGSIGVVGSVLAVNEQLSGVWPK